MGKMMFVWSRMRRPSPGQEDMTGSGSKLSRCYARLEGGGGITTKMTRYLCYLGMHCVPSTEAVLSTTDHPRMHPSRRMDAHARNFSICGQERKRGLINELTPVCKAAETPNLLKMTAQIITQ